MILNYNLSKSLLLLNPDISKTLFLDKVGASFGYSKDMFSRLYDSIFSELVNVDEEYDKFYSFEYESFEYFLYQKLNLSSDDIDELLNERKLNPHCVLFRTDRYSYGDYGLSQFTYSDNMYYRIMKLIKAKI